MVQDIKGYVHDFCRDQHGSRFIQQKLADALPEEIMAVFEEVQPHAISLMQDVFGNYVIQKCFEHGSKVSPALFLMLTRCSYVLFTSTLEQLIFCSDYWSNGHCQPQDPKIK